jgi:hypothetical protein
MKHLIARLRATAPRIAQVAVKDDLQRFNVALKVFACLYEAIGA